MKKKQEIKEAKEKKRKNTKIKTQRKEKQENEKNDTRTTHKLPNHTRRGSYESIILKQLHPWKPG